MKKYIIKYGKNRTLHFEGELIGFEDVYDKRLVDDRDRESAETVALRRKLYRTNNGQYVCELEVASNIKSLNSTELEVVTDEKGVREFFGEGKGTEWFYETCKIGQGGNDEQI